MKKTGYISLLRSGRYLPFFISQVLTNLSDGLLAVAVVYFSIELDASPFQLGIITFTVTLSRGFLGPLGGLVGDRMNKKVYLVTIEVVRTTLMFVGFLLFILNYLNIWGLMVIGALISTLFAVSVPVAKSVIPKLVEEDELQLANGLIQTITWPAFFLGSGLLAVILPLGLEPYILLIVAISFLVSSGLLLMLPVAIQTTTVSDASAQKKNMLQDLAQGYQELKSDSLTHARVWSYGIFTFFWRGSLQIVIPLAIIQTLNSPSWVYGALMLANGAAEFIANLAVGKARFRRPLVFTFLCEVLIGIGLLTISASFALPIPEVGMLIGVVLIGLAASTIDIPLLTVLQKNVSEHNIGKVISYWFTIGSAGGALGTLAMGAFFEFVSIQMGTAILGSIVLGVGLLMLYWAQRASAS